MGLQSGILRERMHGQARDTCCKSISAWPVSSQYDVVARKYQSHTPKEDTYERWAAAAE